MRKLPERADEMEEDGRGNDRRQGGESSGLALHLSSARQQLERWVDKSGTSARMSSDYAPTISVTPARSRQRSLTRRPSAGALATPQPARTRPPPLPTSALPLQSSPHYSTSLRSRHSLYGTEDRVVLDLGSRVWKAGFSGEGAPRECRSVLALGVGAGAGDEEGAGLWGLEKGEIGETEWEIREERLKRGLRDVWFK